MKAILLSKRRSFSIFLPRFVFNFIALSLLLAWPSDSPAEIPDAPDLSFKTPAAKKFTQTITSLVQGLEYLGGDPPKLIAIIPTGEIEVDGKIHYKLKFVYRRVSRDRGDRKFPILKAKNYASAIAHLFGINAAVANTVVTFFPKAVFGGRRFPTLFCVADYKLFYKEEGDSLFSFNYRPVRRPHPNFKNKLIVENLGRALAPGNYQLKIEANAELDSSHPWVQFYNLVNWVLWAQSPIEVSLISIVGSPDELIIDTSKEVVKSALLETEATSHFSVLAKIPRVLGINRAEAQRKLEQRSLAVQFVSVYDPNPAKAGKVKSVSPAQGEWARAGSNVILTHYALSGAAPTPTPKVTSTDVFAAWIRPDRLTCCTTSDGIYTYAYQGGIQSSMPSNGILLQGGFSTQAALESWVCNRPVHYHYWARNWALINGYTVSQLPCSINS